MAYIDVIRKIDDSGLYTTEIVGDDVVFIQSKRLNQIDWLRNAFSTRIGGVSDGYFSSMNLNYGRGDKEENVLNNFKIFARAIGSDENDMVYSMQTHTTNVIRVGAADKGNGVTKPQKFKDVDGLVTNEPGVCLVTTYADCVPIYLVDVKNKAIGLSHSGWRGTVGRISKKTIELMGKEFGTRPEDIISFIGPSICQDCYEVGIDVANAFMDAYKQEQYKEILKQGKEIGKFQLNLWQANVINLLEAGVKKENIEVTDICTCCNPYLLYSHRASKGNRGGLCAFLEIV